MLRKKTDLHPGLLRQQPQSVLELVHAAHRVPAAVEVHQRACFVLLAPFLPGGGVQHPDRDRAVRAADGGEFDGTDRVDLVLWDGVDAEDSEVVRTLLRVGVCPAEVEVWVRGEEGFDGGCEGGAPASLGDAGRHGPSRLRDIN